jgi:hypothetical protein
MNLSCLPTDITSKIFTYISSPVADIIRMELFIYENDHNHDMPRSCRMYLVKNIMSFSDYYFDKLQDEYSYDSSYDNFLDLITMRRSFTK